MPPPPVILNDTVVQVTNALPPTLQRRFVTKSIITQTREALRLVQTKVPLGTLGKYDRQETRAAVLLDYVLRKQSSCTNNSSTQNQQQQETTIDLKHLAAVNGTKLAHFQTLHQTLGNYFHDIYHKNSNNSRSNHQQRTSSNSSSTNNRNTTTEKPTRNTRGGDDGNNGNGGVRNLRHTGTITGSKNTNRAITTTTILPDLAIRLAGYLQNVHAVTVQAARLLHNMRDYSLSSQQQLSAVERRGQEYDYVRYWPAYEAAAFFVVATTWQNALHHYGGAGGASPFSMTSTTSSNITRRQSKKSKKSGATSTALTSGNTGGVLMATGDDEDTGGGQQQQPLQLRLEHLVAACNQFTLLQLKERLPHVQKVAALLVAAQQEQGRDAQKQLQQQQREDNPPPNSKRARLIGTDAANVKSSKKRMKGNAEVTQTTSCTRGIVVGNGGDNIGVDGEDDNAVLSLDRWAECILSEARARVQNTKKSNGEMENQSESSDENKGDGDGDSMDQAEFWTRAAADQVLQKYNLLDAQQQETCNYNLR